MAEILKRVEDRLNRAKDDITRDVNEFLDSSPSPATLSASLSKVGKKVIDRVSTKIDSMLDGLKKIAFKSS